jgi:uncharacterized protein (DUF58 family)
VIPKELLRTVRRIQIRTSRLVNDVLAGQYESVFKGRGMEFKEVREYQPGDEIRFIDWNVTARMDRPYVKLFAEERELTVMLVVDASGSGMFGTGDKLKNELAAELCAVLAFSAIKNNDKVGLIMFTDEVEKYVPPKKGRTHVLRVVREVLYFKPRGTGTNIPAALEFLDRVTTRRCVLFLVSDFMAEAFEHAMGIANKRHDFIAITITDPRETELPDVGMIELRDAETGELVFVDTHDRRVRQEFRQKNVQRIAARDELFRATAVDVVDVFTDKPYAEALYKFFRMRERRLA